MRITVTARFTDEPTREHRREYLVPAWGRWAMTLDELRPELPTQADAVVRIRCEGACWATTALWHDDIRKAVAPTVTPVPFMCEEARQ